MDSTDKVEIAKQAIKEIMEEHQVSEHKPTAKQLLFRLLSQNLNHLEGRDIGVRLLCLLYVQLNCLLKNCSFMNLLLPKKKQLDSLQEEDSDKLCPEEKPKEQWNSFQDERVELLCPEVDRTEEKPKEKWDTLQEEDVEKVDKTEEKPGKQLDSLQEKDVEKLCPEVDRTAEIIKEVRNVKRQNLITHCLVSTMILLTAAWQISKVSLLLKVKNGLRNPFNFFGGIIKDLILKGARREVDGEQSSGQQKPAIKAPLIELPDLPPLDLSIFDSTDEE